MTRPTPLRLLSSLAAAWLLVALAPAGATAATRAQPDGGAKRSCVYPGAGIGGLAPVGGLLRRDFDCAQVYNDASPTWEGWEDPWFTHHPDPNLNWARWATAPGRHRQLIVTQNLFPASETNAGWLRRGARGAYAHHARALARTLVARGLGRVVIRLAHEANGTWYPYSIGTSRLELARWRRFWRLTVLAMRSVPGADFRFDWCVNAAVRPIPPASFYPGDDVVDIVGVDAYDGGVPGEVPAGDRRWRTIYTRRGGIRDMLRFARAHGKPLSIPEWGIGPADRNLSAGDDPAYVSGLASVVRNNRVAYQGYFYAHEWGSQLAASPASLAIYRRHFGADGESAGHDGVTIVDTIKPWHAVARRSRGGAARTAGGSHPR